MRHEMRWIVLSTVALALAALAACAAPAQQAAPAGPAEPAKPAAPAPPPAVPAKPAEPAKPAVQPAKPAAQPAKPAAEPAKPATSAEPKKLLAGASDTTSSHYAYWTSVANVINRKVPGFNVTVAATGGGVPNLNLMGKGEVDFGVATDDLIYLAYAGLGQFKDKPMKELRWLWFYSANQHALIVREDSGVKTLDDLSGKEFNPCGRGQSCEVISKNVLEALGIRPKWYTAGLDDAVQAVKDRRIVGYGKPMAGRDTPDGTMLDLMATTKIRVLGFSEEQAKKAQDAHPYYAFTSISANVFKGQEWNKDPIRTVGFGVGSFGSTRLPEDTAYAVVKAVVEDNLPGGAGVQASAFPGVKGIDFAKLTAEEGLLNAPPLHAGAVKYYKEVGAKIPDKLIPPEAKR